MKIQLPLIAILFTGHMVHGQLAYNENQYSVRNQHDIQYGVAPGFAGTQDTLMLDIYKPVGDSNCRRPCLILVHGGEWISGSKQDANMLAFANEFAEKGWVVASIDYRLGTHKAPNYTQFPSCTSAMAPECGYVADTAEIIRANYRGQQDAKDAIRFMKNRSEADSTDIDNFFIAGENAGGFIALAAAFYDKDTEKPLACEGLDDAPEPDTDLLGCLPEDFTLTRGNLDDIQGNNNMDGNDATVQGVGSLSGGVFNLSVIDNTSEWPAIYLFHQGADVVVNYDYGKILGRTDVECFAPNSTCQPYANYPRAYGGKGIKMFLDGFGVLGPDYAIDLVENYDNMNNCASNGHMIDNVMLRAGNMASFFAERVAGNGNVPSACFAGIEELQLPFRVAPNPSEGVISIESQANDGIVVYNALGAVVYSGKIQAGSNKIDLTGMGKGVFMIQSESNRSAMIRIVIR